MLCFIHTDYFPERIFFFGSVDNFNLIFFLWERKIIYQFDFFFRETFISNSYHLAEKDDVSDIFFRNIKN